MCLVERGVGAPNDHIGRDTLGNCSVDDLVVDVGDIPNVGHVVSRPLEVSTDHIEDHRGTAVTEVRIRLDRRPTHVHSDLAGIAGLKLLELPSERVVDLHRT